MMVCGGEENVLAPHYRGGIEVTGLHTHTQRKRQSSPLVHTCIEEESFIVSLSLNSSSRVWAEATPKCTAARGREDWSSTSLESS